MTKVYICDPSMTRAQTCGLMPGQHWFKARKMKDGPYLPVMTEVVEPRDAEGNLIGDVVYRVVIDGREIPFAEWQNTALFGEEIAELDYKTMLADGPWTQANYGVRSGEKADLRKLPPILPP